MGLRIVSRRGRDCPVVACDHCGRPIVDATRGNYQWRPLGDGALFYTHKGCCRAFEAARGGHWCAVDLECLPVYLANNLGVKWLRAGRRAALLASL
jgi:hypothetical protein